MKMNDLFKYDVPWEVIQLWREQESDHLLPLQERAVRDHGLFSDDNLLVHAPTSAGKTFIGEMAAIRTALRRKQVVYLVPLKALAEEKYNGFRKKYDAYGLKTIISTRDHREFDQDLESGDFSIAVVVYEKLEQLLVRKPERLGEIELVVADEIELISDPERGADVEILMTQLLRADCRIVALSAVVGAVEALALWLRAEVVSCEQRPAELRYGVLHGGMFRYRCYGDHTDHEEVMAGDETDSQTDVITQNVCAMTDRGENCIVFVKSRHEARRGAEHIAQCVDAPSAANAIEALEPLEPTYAREVLLSTLPKGVAFHSADLSPDERRIVEEAVRAGEVRVLVCTSTLAKGINLPAQNVFVSDDKWHFDRRIGVPWKTPIDRGEFENMGGRAGRYRGGAPFGRSILVAATAFDAETLWRRYIDSGSEPVEPRLATAPLEDCVLRLAAASTCRTESEVHDFFESTLTGQWIWAERLTADEAGVRITAAINRAEDLGMLSKDEEGRIRATPIGLAVAAKGITMATARAIEEWIHASERRAWQPIDLLIAAALTEDGQLQGLTLTEREYTHGGYVDRLRDCTDHDASAEDVPVQRLRACTHQPFFEEVRAIKGSLILVDWIAEASLRDIEEQYHTMAGQVLTAADQVGWIVDAAAAIAQALGCDQEFIERVEALSGRVQFGLRENLVPAARWRHNAVSRFAILGLASAGIDDIKSIAEAGPAALRIYMDRALAKDLHAWACKHIAPGEIAVDADDNESHPILVVDDANPGQIHLDGAEIHLQEKQYLLIRMLAEFPGECVPYDQVYHELWGDVCVEDGQIAYQKSQLLKAIRMACPARKGIIKTTPKRGYTLMLDSGQVHLKRRPARTAA